MAKLSGRSAVAGGARQNLFPKRVPESDSCDDVMSDSNETEDRNSLVTEAGYDSGYQSSWSALSGTQNGDEVSGGPRTDDPASLEDGVYTFMLRQIPRHYTQLMFLADVSRRGFMGFVDFIYLPSDAKKGKNVGFGFISFTEVRHASAFRRKFDGTYLDFEMRRQDKPLRIHPAEVQGYEDNFVHFARTRSGLRSSPQLTPLFVPGGCWAGLPQEIQKELVAYWGSQGAQPPGWLPAAPAEDQLDLGSGPGDPRSWVPLRPEGPAASGPERPRAAATRDGTAPAEAPPAGRIRPPPGLPPPGLFAAAPAPAAPAAPAAAPAPGLDPMRAYRQLEERKLDLLKELAVLQEKQRRALASSVQGSGECKPVGIGLAQM